jgi:molybdopterin/thiamine biosynthesis adenylyltransferase
VEYNDAYQRNRGLFNDEQVQRLKSAKVVIAGVGGVGGIQSVTLARFGIGELVIFDPGVFDEPDMNRQYGAMKSTIGRNKAVVTEELLRDINPFLKLTALDYAPQERRELDRLLDGSSLVIDAIDYLGFDYKALFAQSARDLKLYNYSAPIPDFGAMLMIFDPQGMTLEEFYQAPADRSLWPGFQIPLHKILGEQRQSQNIADFVNGRRPYISSNAGAAALAGGLLATEAALAITGVRKAEDLATAPLVTYLNLFERTFEVFNVLPERG